MSVADDLRAARALIDSPEKWRKGSYGYNTGCLCAAAALWSLDSEKRSMSEASHFLRQHVPGGRKLVHFNDDPATTHADILALFDRAIQAAEAH